MTLKMTGAVKWFNAQKGYGFLTGIDGAEVFVHYSGIIGEGFKTLAEAEAVEYDVVECDKGVQAINVLRTSMMITDGGEAYKITLI